MSYVCIHIYIFFFLPLKHYDFKNTPIYRHFASRRFNVKALIEGNRLTT